MNTIALKLLFKDLNFKLLFFNMLLVLVGYASANVFGMGVFGVVKIVRSILLFSSFGILLYYNGIDTSRILNFQQMLVVVIFILIGSFFGEGSFLSFYKGLTFIVPFFYIISCINYLLRYGAYNLLLGLSVLIMLAYTIVPLSYLLFGADLSSTNIYGAEEGDAFVSNHYGWSSTIFILAALTVLKYYPLSKLYKFLIGVFIPFCFYLLMISASRSGMIALAIAFFFFMFKEKHISVSNKLIFSLIPLVILLLISLQENSVIDFLQQKNEQQLETGVEGRYISFLVMKSFFEVNPSSWFYGVGMFNYTVLENGGSIIQSYHNSYFDILFGVGFIVFIFFLTFMVFRPLKVFFKTTATYSLLIFPLMIIPFFEGDLTAGQFLFFPWFAYMILLNAREFHPRYKLASQQ